MCPVDEVFCVAFGVVAHLHDAGAGFDEFAQHGLFANDVRVEAGVGRCGHGRNEGVQVGGAADPGDGSGFGQGVGHGHGVCWFAGGVEVEDGVVDGFVRRDVEVVAAQEFDNVRNCVL